MDKNKYGQFVQYLVCGLNYERITEGHDLWGKYNSGVPFKHNGEDAVIYENAEDWVFEITRRRVKVGNHDPIEV